jgi:hypothetical protein
METVLKASAPVIRVSRGRFAPEKYRTVINLIEESAASLVPAIQELHGLLYYHAAVDPTTSTVVNVSIWESMADARQMETLPPMLAQRPILEGAGDYPYSATK